MSTLQKRPHSTVLFFVINLLLFYFEQISLCQLWSGIFGNLGILERGVC